MPKKKLLIFTDTTDDQINGVTRCIDELQKNLGKHIETKIISADNFFNVPFFWYKEIRLSFSIPKKIKKEIHAFRPDYIHIETEWPVGISAAFIAKRENIAYTTTFHTKFPEYLQMRNKLVKEKYVHKYLHYIHDGAEKIFVSNTGMFEYLEKNRYKNSTLVPFWIDHDLFFAGERKYFLDEPRIKLLFVGRIAIEKNIEDFLNISDKYAKYVVGDGPDREELTEKYSSIQFLGIKKWQELADIYRSIDAFVFPSKTDTLGLVNLEAMASGKPVIAYDIDTLRGIITNGKNGTLVREEKSLETWVESALQLKVSDITKSVAEFHWENYRKMFIKNQVQISWK